MNTKQEVREKKPIMKVNFTESVRQLEKGEFVKLQPENYDSSILRTICFRIAKQEKKRFTVNKTDVGECIVTRIM